MRHIAACRLAPPSRPHPVRRDIGAARLSARLVLLPTERRNPQLPRRDLPLRPPAPLEITHLRRASCHSFRRYRLPAPVALALRRPRAGLFAAALGLALAATTGPDGRCWGEGFSPHTQGSRQVRVS